MWQVKCELLWAVAALSPGPHRAIRHPALRTIWWRGGGGREELRWEELWDLLSAAVPDGGHGGELASSGGEGRGPSGLVLEELGQPAELYMLAGDVAAREAVQAAVERRSSAFATGHVSPAMLDAAVPSGQSLLEALRNLRLKGLADAGPQLRQGERGMWQDWGTG